MQEADSKDYFERRAEEERAAAESAEDERAAQSHRELANKFDKLAKECADAPADAPATEPGILAREFRIVP